MKKIIIIFLSFFIVFLISLNVYAFPDHPLLSIDNTWMVIDGGVEGKNYVVFIDNLYDRWLVFYSPLLFTSTDGQNIVSPHGINQTNCYYTKYDSEIGWYWSYSGHVSQDTVLTNSNREFYRTNQDIYYNDQIVYELYIPSIFSNYYVSDSVPPINHYLLNGFHDESSYYILTANENDDCWRIYFSDSPFYRDINSGFGDGLLSDSDIYCYYSHDDGTGWVYDGIVTYVPINDDYSSSYNPLRFGEGFVYSSHLVNDMLLGDDVGDVYQAGDWSPFFQGELYGTEHWFDGFFGGVFEGLDDFLGRVWNIINPMSDSFFIKVAFVPPSGYFISSFQEIKTSFDFKVPLISQLFSFLVDIKNIIFQPSEPPVIEITMPERYGGQTMPIIDFSYFADYRVYIINFIRFISWFNFLKALARRIPRVISSGPA